MIFLDLPDLYTMCVIPVGGVLSYHYHYSYFRIIHCVFKKPWFGCWIIILSYNGTYNNLLKRWKSYILYADIWLSLGMQSNAEIKIRVGLITDPEFQLIGSVYMKLQRHLVDIMGQYRLKNSWFVPRACPAPHATFLVFFAFKIKARFL